METKTIYFEQPGPQNTRRTLQLAKERAEQLGITDVVLASYTGDTGVKALQLFSGYNLIVVAGVVGFRGKNKVDMIYENQSLIEHNGGKILFAGHAFGMLGRAVHRKFGALQVDEVIAHVLRLFGQGVKVGCEIVCMATDAGLIKSDQEVIAIAGSAKGADTALVVKASNTHTFFDTRILEIICKPRA
ncbi:TPA: hypothetical protein EYP66_06500 [Candidatus Poribacteria bacterium]|nr:hypothetical protein [Candidatus Poribacteria bacterium]